MMAERLPSSLGGMSACGRRVGKGTDKTLYDLGKIKSFIKQGDILGNYFISKIDDNTQLIFRKDMGEMHIQ